MAFTPPLLFASYTNLAGYPTSGAGIAAAWSGLYALLALRRRQPLRGKLSAWAPLTPPPAAWPTRGGTLRGTRGSG